MISQSPLMVELNHKAKLVGRTNATVLITGENGTGKEVMARMLHYYGSSKEKPMVAVNCGAIPSDLVESELFGHEKGAFTGAFEQKKGCFEQANHSTLFLDEIGEMSLSAQVKLLRAVEVGAFRRIGGREEIKVNLRLISATNKVLCDQVKSGSFREDLYYRLNVVELYLPPLRHRKEDIPLLVDFYKDHYLNEYKLDPVTFSDECIGLMMAYDWPGNVRELKNTVERCLVLNEKAEIQADSLPAAISAKPHNQIQAGYTPAISTPAKGFIQIPVGTSLEEVERRVINETLNSVDNNKTEAAKLLGFARKTLHNKLDRYAKDNYV
ncbi:MAG: sigma-54 dependent transcriptional regulator [Balneolia bacterium]|nr:sigma-54 dependent transcriptional regulator [Balneolia bacterium]